MKLFVQTCACCKKQVSRSRGRINEAKKLGWKTYCSLLCQSKILNKQKGFRCADTNCNNTFFRAPHDIRSAELYCSRSCAATVNNSKFPKRKAATFQCAYCHRNFRGHQTYCSRTCKSRSQTVSGPEIIKGIQWFYKKHGRIPVKIEFSHYGAAQDRFGSWHKAIEAVGYKPNPVRFAQRHVARDGHQCDSFAEKVVDAWLYNKKIKHERNIRYPGDPKLTADFITRRRWIEFFGLAGEMKEYDALIKRKQKLAKKHGLPLVEIYPKDLFPINNLSKILATNSR